MQRWEAAVAGGGRPHKQLLVLGLLAWAGGRVELRASVRAPKLGQWLVSASEPVLAAAEKLQPWTVAQLMWGIRRLGACCSLGSS